MNTAIERWFAERIKCCASLACAENGNASPEWVKLLDQIKASMTSQMTLAKGLSAPLCPIES